MVLSLLINYLASQGSIILKWYSYYRHIHFYFCLFSGLAPSPWCGGPWGLWRGCFARDTAARDDVSERRSGSWQPEWWRRYGERHTGPSGPVPEKYRRAYGELFNTLRHEQNHRHFHNNDVIMSTMASSINSVSIVCSTVCSDADQREHQSSASLAFVRGIHRWPVNSSYKGPETWKMFPFDDVIMLQTTLPNSFPSVHCN